MGTNMIHGGKRNNAGRKCAANIDVVVDDLIAPALQFIIDKKHNTISITEKDILAAYGKAGLTLWKDWFEISLASRPITVQHAHAGRTASTWKIKLTMCIAANKLLEDVIEELTFPPLKLKEVKHRKQYDAFWREHKKLWEKWTKEGKINYAYPAPQPYVPYVDLEVINNTTAAAQWAELIDGSARGDFSAPYTSTVEIDESEVPY